MPPVRRLTAILAADVAGYSRLMGVDEEGTHDRLKAHLRELVEPKIKEHRGRTVKNTGDGLLAEFSSVVAAVRCAVEVQQGMAEANAAIPPDKRIEFRVGINLGDVIAEGEDIFGDGVNVAARLEALAEPGGICVSRVVRDQVRDRLDFAFEDMGEQSVKNIARPVRVYALRPERLAAAAAAPHPGLLTRPSWRGRIIVGTVAAAALVIVCIAWWFWPAATLFPRAEKAAAQTTAASPPVGTAPAATSIAQPFVAPRLSIVVLPFSNFNNDPEQQYFVDALTEDLTTDLSQMTSMFVISRNTAFTYKDKPVNVKHIGRELGVRYVLEGSVRRSGNQIRLHAQLIDAESDAHMWAERFDRDTGDLFDLENEIASRIAVALSLELPRVEAARPTDNPDALDYILRGRAAIAQPQSRAVYAETISLFERALALDPQSVEAKSRLASSLVNRVLDDETETAAADVARANVLIGQVLRTSPGNSLAHWAKAQLLRQKEECEEAIPEYEMALASNPNWPSALSHLGKCKTLIGLLEEAILLQEQAIRLSPRDPIIGMFYARIGEVYLLQSHTDEAIIWLEKARTALPEPSFTHASLASAYALKGENQRAAAELGEARRLSSDARYSSIARLKAVGYFGVPKIRALFEATYFAGLRKAGMPEE
jgi:TolB-like protein/class 3 adenylate cyclase/cytochrome c-type biogenesis protein CcmH/NrfG